MAKRKSRAKKQPPKKMKKLEKVFNCPFCNHVDSVECIIERKERTGGVFCYICASSYSTSVTNLTEPIDIYHEWIDECERINDHGDSDA